MSGKASLAALCPAKVNLGLRVLGRRPDGYHELDTVFQAIDLWDRIEIEPADRLTLACDDPDVPTDGTNLVLRAAELLRPHARSSALGAAVTLRKSIPAQAGLGGGSSDAAGALRLFTAYWEVELDDAGLLDIARALGADVPFFLIGGTARGTGRGDRIEPLAPAGPIPLVLGKPPFGVSTSEVFRALSSELTLPSNDVRFRPFSGHKWMKPNDLARMENDLERVVFPRWPALAEFRDGLRARGARHAALSGSGSTVFGVFADEREARKIADDLAARFTGWRVLATRAVDAAAHVVGTGCR